MRTQDVLDSINMTFDIFKKLGAEPIFFGSLIGAVINGNFYREVGDVDILAEAKFKHKIEHHLKNAGFTKCINKNIGFISILGCWPTEFSDGKHKFSFIFGNFLEKYFELPLKYGFSFRWPREELCYRYKLGDKQFLGLSPEFYALFLTIAAKKKEKRKKDTEIVFKKINHNRLLEIIKQDFIYWHNGPVPGILKLQQFIVNKKIIDNQ